MEASLQKYEVGQDTGSDVYHPHLNVFRYVNPKGMGITNTISHAELAAIAAAVIHGYSHIAADSNITAPNQKAAVTPKSPSPPHPRRCPSIDC